MNLTVDASVVVKWFVPEELSDEARMLLDYPHDFQAPDILLAEFGNTIWKKFRRGEVAFLQPYMDELLGLDEVIALHPVGEQVTRAVQIAGETGPPGIRLPVSGMRRSDRVDCGYSRPEISE